MAVSIPAIVAIVLFYVAILAIGIWAGRKGKSTTDDAMVAGRNLGMFIGILTMTATWVGGGYINGSAEKVFKAGLVMCQAPFGYATSLLIGGIFFAGKMREQGYVTMLDPFQKKYGDVMTAFLYIPPLCGDIFWSGAILSALGSTIAVILDLNMSISIIISATFAIAYTVFGGLYAVAYTDVVQLFAIFVGLWLCIPFAILHPASQSIAETTHDWIGEFPTYKTGHWIDSSLLLIFGGIPWQVYFQRVLAAKNASTAKVLSYAAAFGAVFMAVPAILIGAIAKSTDWTMTDIPNNGTDINPQMILPLVLRYLCPDWVTFIGLGAVSAAVMSSSDSSVLSSAAMFARNIYRPIHDAIARKPASDKHIIWVMRVAIIVVGMAATIIAITVNSTYGLWHMCSDFVYVILFPQLVCVLYVPFTERYGSAFGFTVGLVLRMLGGEDLLNMPSVIPYSQQFPYRTIVMLISFASIISGSALVRWRDRRRKSQEDLTEAEIKPLNSEQKGTVGV